MKHRMANILLATGAFVLLGVAAFAWGGGLLLEGESLPARVGLLGVGLAAAGFSLVLGMGWMKLKCLAVQRHFEALCDLDPRELHSDAAFDKVPPVPESSPWYPLAKRVRETLVAQSRRAQELDHARAALEIRHQRATSRCEQIRAILSTLSDPVIAVDAFDELLLANPAAESLFNLDNASTHERTIGQLVRCEKLVELLVTTSHRKAPSKRAEEIEIIDAMGRPLWYRVSATKLAPSEDTEDSQDSASEGAVAVLREIGHQKALQKRNAEFVSAVSHEMKTPLAGIKAYVELLVDGDAEDEQTREEFLTVINSQADRLQRLVDNLLNLARIEAGVVNVNKENRSLNELLEEAVHVVQPSAEAKQIELVAELSPMYLGVLADRDMLLQAAINLLSNAVKYTLEKGRVTLRSRVVGDEVAFEVEDTGVGLSEEDCGRVFEKFYRVSKDKKMASGTGLGLSLAKHIIEDVHGGRLSVQSAVGAGSTFAAILPKSGQTA